MDDVFHSRLARVGRLRGLNQGDKAGRDDVTETRKKGGVTVARDKCVHRDGGIGLRFERRVR